MMREMKLELDVSKSPCSGVCKMHEPTGWCQGCARTIDEIRVWRDADADTRRRILLALPDRRAALVEQGIFTAADVELLP